MTIAKKSHSKHVSVYRIPEAVSKSFVPLLRRPHIKIPLKLHVHYSRCEQMCGRPLHTDKVLTQKRKIQIVNNVEKFENLHLFDNNFLNTYVPIFTTSIIMAFHMFPHCYKDFHICSRRWKERNSNQNFSLGLKYFLVLLLSPDSDKALSSLKYHHCCSLDSRVC